MVKILGSEKTHCFLQSIVDRPRAHYFVDGRLANGAAMVSPADRRMSPPRARACACSGMQKECLAGASDLIQSFGGVTLSPFCYRESKEILKK
jgi:hypothetical protein